MDIPARVLKDKRLEQSEAVERLERLERLQFYFELLNLEPPQGMAGAERWNPIGMTGTGFGI
jgi:hypothetical protein